MNIYNVRKVNRNGNDIYQVVDAKGRIYLETPIAVLAEGLLEVMETRFEYLTAMPHIG